MDNPFPRIYDDHAERPEEERRQRVTTDVRDAIPFTGTAGLEVAVYMPTRVVVEVDDREALHNHVGTFHAAALSLLAETASGLVVALNVRDPAVPILRSMDVAFRRLAAGRLTAEATLSNDDAARIRDRPIGKVDVEVAVTDPSGEAPVDATMHWAWIPAERLSID
jgi:acyl-coenzyme A thioesterase PaaI-like protein